MTVVDLLEWAVWPYLEHPERRLTGVTYNHPSELVTPGKVVLTSPVVSCSEYGFVQTESGTQYRLVGQPEQANLLYQTLREQTEA